MRLRCSALGALTIALTVTLGMSSVGTATAAPDVVRADTGADPSADPSTDPSADPVSTEDPRAVAEAALAEVEDLLADAGVGALQSQDDTTTGDPADPDAAAPDSDDQGAPDPTDPDPTDLGPGHRAELTMALRDLRLHQDALAPSDRKDAEQLLGRPGPIDSPACGTHDPCYAEGADVKRTCSDLACVHWVTRADDRKNGARRSFVDTVLSSVTHVAQTYLDAGYREVKRDGLRGGNSKPDIYLADLASRYQQLYGYCDTDSQIRSHAPTTAYCVLENDYKEFPARTPEQNMRVTAAHEFFHAVQFAYDYAEDRWVMEATATWAEDEVYDTINDNVIFLPYGPLGYPHRPLDTTSSGYFYGSWIFFRYLTERWPAETGDMPALVQELWTTLAHSGDGSKGFYSVQAVKRALAARGSDMTSIYNDFSTANRRPARNYDEARTSRYPAAPVWKRLRPSKADRRIVTKFRLNHLSARTLRYIPESKGRARLRLRFDLNRKALGGAATVTVKRRGKAPVTRRVDLNRKGDGVRRTPFRKGRIRWVEVTIVNASTRYRCDLGRGSFATCDGAPRDNRKIQVVKATRLR